MTVGIASLWWNHTELLPEFVRMMSVGGWDKLVLVDNASTDEAHEAYQQAIAELPIGASVLRMPANNVLHGWNAGMSALGTDILIQMANDVLMTDEHWLEWGLAGMAAGILQGPQCWHRGFPYIDGCMMAVMRLDWERLGGLDAAYYEHPGYWSDVDFCWRALQAGMTVRPCRSGIRHLTAYSGGNAPQHEAANRKNAVNFVNRYIEPLRYQRAMVMQE